MQQEPQEQKTKRVTFRDSVRFYKSEVKFREELLKFFRFMFESPKLQGLVTWSEPGILSGFTRKKPAHWSRRRMSFAVEGAPRGGCSITQYVEYYHCNAVKDYMIVVNNGLCVRDVLITPDEFTNEPGQWSPKSGTLKHRKYWIDLHLRDLTYGNAIAASFLRYALQTITPICELSDDQKEFITKRLTPYKRKDD